MVYRLQFRELVRGTFPQYTTVTMFTLLSRGKARSIVMRLFVCLSVCLSARITRKPHCRTSPNIYACYSCGRVSVLLWRRCDTLSTSVLWMASCFHTMGPLGQNQARRYILKTVARWRYLLDVRKLQCFIFIVIHQTGRIIIIENKQQNKQLLMKQLYTK